jgi:hypothetical protein
VVPGLFLEAFMPRRAFNLAKLRSTGFEDASRYELDKAFELKFGRVPPTNQDDFSLRDELIKAFTVAEGEDLTTAQPLPTASEKPSVPSALAKVFGKVPNLKSTGRWDGRKRRVTIHKSDEMSKSTGYKVGYDGILWTVAFDQTVDMPWPYWQSLDHTALLDDCSMEVTKWIKDDEGKIIDIQRTPRWIKTVNYTDHGDTPGTENLPEDYSMFFRGEAAKNRCFEGFPRVALTMIHNILIEPKDKPFNAEYFGKMEDIDIRIAIAQVLGPSVEELLMNEVYAESA